MAEESLSIIVEQSLKSESLLELKDAKKTILYEPIFAVIKLITGDVIGSVESIVKGITDYKEREFFRKYVIYLNWSILLKKKDINSVKKFKKKLTIPLGMLFLG